MALIGLPEMILIAIAIGIFFYGPKKVGEWVACFKKPFDEAKAVIPEELKKK